MTLLQTIQHLRRNPSDAWYYWQGTIRYWLYRRYPSALRRHIKQQFEYRKVAAQACTDAGACLCCSCETPSLYFANKPCSISKHPICKQLVDKSEPCYPKMMNKREWKQFTTKTPIRK